MSVDASVARAAAAQAHRAQLLAQVHAYEAAEAGAVANGAKSLDERLDELSVEIDMHLYEAMLMERRMRVAAQPDLLVNWAHAKSVMAKRQYTTPDRPFDRSFKSIALAPADIYDSFMEGMLAQVRPVAERVAAGTTFQPTRPRHAAPLHASWWVEHDAREAAVRATNGQDGTALLRLARLEYRMNSVAAPNHAYSDKAYA